jgi:hypothetical protein
MRAIDCPSLEGSFLKQYIFGSQKITKNPLFWPILYIQKIDLKNVTPTVIFSGGDRNFPGN